MTDSSASINTIDSKIYSHGPEWYAKYRRFIHRSADKIRLTNHPIITQLIAETLGTIVLIFYGDGAVAQKFFFNSKFLEVSVGWGAAVTMGIIISGGKASPAYLNPAVAAANSVLGTLRWSLLPLYLILEVLGGFLGAGLLLAAYNEDIIEYTNEFDNGKFLLNSTGGIFVAGKGSSVGVAVADQIITTAILMIGILAVGNNQLVKKPGDAVPILVGMVVYLGVGTYTANASSALNPARDLGPRLLLLATHWGVEAFTVDNYYFWVPGLMPIIGAILGAIIYELLVGIHTNRAGYYLTEESEPVEDTESRPTSEKSPPSYTSHTPTKAIP
ncbi:unnamed protein product [Rodentolepis nana]|uniref:Aquaporin-3 n=1 Tax=Rodentolepis nana TaxID=102285 RepID=A0A0R3T1W2_RODNA|nr:unnamed protein product [Rodentolepis nana]